MTDMSQVQEPAALYACRWNEYTAHIGTTGATPFTTPAFPDAGAPTQAV